MKWRTLGWGVLGALFCCAGTQATSHRRLAPSSSKRMGIQPTKHALRRLNSHSVSNVLVVVVARAGNGAKSRLAGVLSAPQRHALVLAMLADVLAVCHATPEVDGAIVVTHASVALPPRTVRVDDPAEGDMNAAVRAGLSAASARGAETVLVLPADIPCLA